MNSGLLLLVFLPRVWNTLDAALIGLQDAEEQIRPHPLGQAAIIIEVWTQTSRSPPAGYFTVVSRSSISSRSDCLVALISISSLFSWHWAKIRPRSLHSSGVPQMFSCGLFSLAFCSHPFISASQPKKL